MDEEHYKRLLAMLVDTVSGQQQQINALQTALAVAQKEEE